MTEELWRRGTAVNMTEELWRNCSKYDRASYGGTAVNMTEELWRRGTAVNMTERVMTAGNSSKYDRGVMAEQQ